MRGIITYLPMCFGIVRLVTGPLGTGKSYFGVRTAVAALEQGAMVVTNFDMVPDWTEQVARHGRFRRSNSRRVRRRLAEFEGRYLRIHTMRELTELRVRSEPPFAHQIEGPSDAYPNGKWQVREGSVIVILDEAHRWMNARTWSKEGRGELLETFALARKRGFIIYLLAQRAENLDVQVRELFEDHILLKNLRRSMRVFGLRVCPWNVFVAGWYNHAYENELVRTDRYFLGWDRRLYDTMDTVSFHEGEAGGDYTYLPLRAPDDRGEQPPPAALPPATAAPMPDGGGQGPGLPPDPSLGVPGGPTYAGPPPPPSDPSG